MKAIAKKLKGNIDSYPAAAAADAAADAAACAAAAARAAAADAAAAAAADDKNITDLKLLYKNNPEIASDIYEEEQKMKNNPALSKGRTSFTRSEKITKEAVEETEIDGGSRKTKRGRRKSTRRRNKKSTRRRRRRRH